MNGKQNGRGNLNPITALPAEGRKSFTKNGAIRRVRDKAGKQRALLQAAAKLFASKGYHSTTTRDIAAKAGCAEGLIHRYFKGKAGILPALVEERMAGEVQELTERLPKASTFDLDFLQLVDWEVERMWKDRNFLKVIIPCALLEGRFREMLNRVRLTARSEALIQRLASFKKCRTLSSEEILGLVDAMSILGLVCGFMRPVILGHDRHQSKKTALSIAKMLARSV